MATVNITCDQNQDEAVVIADANAETGNHLFKFFTDGVNVFNIASQPLSGDAVDAVTVIEDTSYGFTITAEQALLLNGSASSYKHYLTDKGSYELKNEGTVTVTPLTGTVITPLKPFVNGDNTIRSVVVNRALKPDDDVIYASGVTRVVELTLMEAGIMVGKRYEIKSIDRILNTNGVDIILPGAGTLIHLDAGESCQVKAMGPDDDDWEVFYYLTS